MKNSVEYPNTPILRPAQAQRIGALDLARGFTILCMPAVHTVMMYADPAVLDTALGFCLQAVAEGPGAPLFMFLMGVYTGLAQPKTLREIALRSLGLLLAGYGLNAGKFLLPLWLGRMPEALLRELGVTGNGDSWKLLLMGDIFHFAGLALPLLYLVSRLPKVSPWAALLALLVMATGPLVWDTTTGSDVLDEILRYATGAPPQVFFPLLPWLAYPLAGLALGDRWKRHGNRDSRGMGIAKHSGLLGIMLIVIGRCGARFWPVEPDNTSFYRTAPFETGWHLGIVLLTIAAWSLAEKHIRDNGCFRLLRYSSKHITALYTIQWLLICWTLPVTGFRTLDLYTTMVFILAMTTNTYLIVYTIQLLKPTAKT